MKNLPSLECVSGLIEYDRESGDLIWRVRRSSSIKPGAIAGRLDRNGYRRISINRREYQASHIAWLLLSGAWPTGEIDHCNGDNDDNRPHNLRQATPGQNRANTRRPSTNTSGLKGVIPSGSGRWMAQIGVKRQKIYLGTFDAPEEAHAAYVAAASKFYGEFAKSG